MKNRGSKRRRIANTEGEDRLQYGLSGKKNNNDSSLVDVAEERRQ